MSGTPPTFFVPLVDPDKQEDAFAELAKAIQRTPPELGQRIYSITFNHDGEVWIATVGEQLRGTRTAIQRSRGRKTERTVPLSNPSTVLAIFPGVPFHVWHDAASLTWANPFLTGDPISIEYFRS